MRFSRGRFFYQNGQPGQWMPCIEGCPMRFSRGRFFYAAGDRLLRGRLGCPMRFSRGRFFYVHYKDGWELISKCPMRFSRGRFFYALSDDMALEVESVRCDSQEVGSSIRTSMDGCSGNRQCPMRFSRGRFFYTQDCLELAAMTWVSDAILKRSVLLFRLRKFLPCNPLQRLFRVPNRSCHCPTPEKASTRNCQRTNPLGRNSLVRFRASVELCARFAMRVRLKEEKHRVGRRPNAGTAQAFPTWRPKNAHLGDHLAADTFTDLRQAPVA